MSFSSEPTRVSTAALIRRGDRLLLVRRAAGGDLGECWELPGGKVDPGEHPAQALKRELEEELGVDAAVGESVGEARFVHRGELYHLIGYEVVVAHREVELREHEAYGYYTVSEALNLRLAPSDGALLRSLKGEDPNGDPAAGG